MRAILIVIALLFTSFSCEAKQEFKFDCGGLKLVVVDYRDHSIATLTAFPGLWTGVYVTTKYDVEQLRLINTKTGEVAVFFADTHQHMLKFIIFRNQRMWELKRMSHGLICREERF